jgi:hypothetical protein
MTVAERRGVTGVVAVVSVKGKAFGSFGRDDRGI